MKPFRFVMLPAIGLTLCSVPSPVFPQTAPSVQSQPSKPCQSKPEARQLDFWLGEWVVTTDGQEIAVSSIQNIIDGCVIFENYTEKDGFNGKSFNFYDAHLGKWRQTWVDHTGRICDFVGEVKDGEMRYDGFTYLPDGKKMLRRMTITPLTANKVRQKVVRSLDDGKTWVPAYDFVYVRKS
ncbi:MAG: hypothetical protein K1Y36_01665 [Blastocatellia bacterium]|nr:hypothetical protein [Blastocatellia bacterium]